jgi:hypothetical protein
LKANLVRGPGVVVDNAAETVAAFASHRNANNLGLISGLRATLYCNSLIAQLLYA